MNRSLCLIAVAFLLAGCRQDMHNQPRYKPLAATGFFGDGRSARPEMEGTVARGHLHLDAARYTGKIADQDIDFFPFPVARADVERGRERFDIYCSPCHGRTGDSRGMVVRRGYREPEPLYSKKLVAAPIGHFFDVMTNGFGAMPQYATSIAPDDRWRIAAYIRVLQLTRNATVDDVPADHRAEVQ